MGIPGSWDDIKLSQYKEMALVEGEGADATLARASAATGIPREKLASMSSREFASVMSGLEFVQELPDATTAPEMLLGRTLADLNTAMTVGRTWDAETRQGPEWWHLQVLLSYPPDPWTFEDVQVNEDVWGLPMSQAWPAIARYHAWREFLTVQYKGLFSSPKQESKAPKDETVGQRRKRLAEERREAAKASKWNWFSLVDRVAMGSPMEYGRATALNIIFALNWLSYKKETGQ